MDDTRYEVCVFEHFEHTTLTSTSSSAFSIATCKFFMQKNTRSDQNALICAHHIPTSQHPTSNQATEHLILFRKTTTMTTTQWQSKCIYALIHVAIDRKSRGVPIYGYCIPNRMKRMNECLISLLYLLLRMSASFSLRPNEFYAKITLNALRLYAWKTPPTPYSTQTSSTAF